MTEADLNEFRWVLRRCWSVETSSLWLPENPARGQCNVTALVFYDRKDAEGFIGRFTSRHHQSGLLFDELTSDSALTRTMVLVTHQVWLRLHRVRSSRGCITTNGARHTRDGGLRTGPHILTEMPVFFEVTGPGAYDGRIR